MAQLNRMLAADIESIYIIASPNYSFLSSTGVKEMATFGGDVSSSCRRRSRRRSPNADHRSDRGLVDVGARLQKAEEMTVLAANRPGA